MGEPAEETDHGAIITLEGFDDAIIGFAERNGMAPSICYDRDMVIRTIMRDTGRSRVGAEEHFLINILTADFGLSNPVFLTIDPHLEH